MEIVRRIKTVQKSEKSVIYLIAINLLQRFLNALKYLMFTQR